MKRLRRRLHSVDAVVDALGGPSKVGARYGIRQSAVSNWILRGEIPPGWHLKIYLRLKRMGLKAHPSVFGLDEEELSTSRRRKRHENQAEAA